MDDEFDALVAKGKKTEKEVEGMKQLANEIQYAVVTRKLRPGEWSSLAFVLIRPSHANVLQPNCLSTTWKCYCSNITRHRVDHGPRGQF
jgi:hypothetical protein